MHTAQRYTPYRAVMLELDACVHDLESITYAWLLPTYQTCPGGTHATNPAGSGHVLLHSDTHVGGHRPQRQLCASSENLPSLGHQATGERRAEEHRGVVAIVRTRRKERDRKGRKIERVACTTRPFNDLGGTFQRSTDMEL